MGGALLSPLHRIVRLLSSLTESVRALGACNRLVGVDRYSNSPVLMRALSRVGGGAGCASAAAQCALRLGLTGASFVGAVAAVLLTLALALARGVQQTLPLLLAGVIVGVVLGALKDLVTIQSADILVALTGFMLGNTGLVGWSACATMAGCALACLLANRVLAPVLDGLALGAMRAALVAVLVLATGAAVGQTGLISFVGLAAPQLVRSVVKTTHAALIMLSTAMGGLPLMAADLLAHWHSGSA